MANRETDINDLEFRMMLTLCKLEFCSLYFNGWGGFQAGDVTEWSVRDPEERYYRKWLEGI